jgi:hypothetical protein
VGCGIKERCKAQNAKLKERDQRTDDRGQITTYNV